MAKVVLDLPEPAAGEDPAAWLERCEAKRISSISLPIFSRVRLPYGWNMFELHCQSSVTNQPELRELRGQEGLTDDGTTVFKQPQTVSAYAVNHWFGDCPNSYGTPANLFNTRYTWYQTINTRKAAVIVMGPISTPRSFSISSAGTANRWPTQMWALWNGEECGNYVLPFDAISQRKNFLLNMPN